MSIRQFVIATAFSAICSVSQAANIVIPTTYYVDSKAEHWTGTATRKVAGACKIAPTKYSDAQLGEVYDNFDTYIGKGIVSSGGELIALFDDWTSSTVGYQHNKTSSKEGIQYVIRINSDRIQSALVSISGCDVNTSLEVLDTANSFLKLAIDYVTGKHTATINSSFIGYNNMMKSEALIQKAGKFTGSVTFTGTYTSNIVIM